MSINSTNIFEIQARKVVLNKNVLMIPALKALIEKYPGCYLNVLNYVYFTVDPSSPYDNYPESKKPAKLMADFPGKYNPQDKEITEAISWCKDDMMETPEDRLYNAAKQAAENVANSLVDQSKKISGLKDLDNLMKCLKSVQTVTEALGSTRKARETARDSLKVRGNVKKAYDQ